MGVKGNLLICAGGTGGHIYPGIAIFEELSHLGHKVFFLTTKRMQNLRALQDPTIAERLIFYSAPRLSKSPLFPLRMAGAIVRATAILLRYRIQAVIAMGGYASFPALLAALWTGRPIYLFEQNRIPGRVTRIFAKKARRVFLAFPIDGLSGTNQIVVGNPIREVIRKEAQAIWHVSKPIERIAFDLDRERASQRFSLLFMGGSQGAKDICDLYQQFKESGLAREYDALLIAGQSHYPDYKHLQGVIDYTEEIGQYYQKAHVVIGRAGAGSLFETALFGLPMILIPYPYAADQHQQANADYIQSIGAGIALDSSATMGDLLDAIRTIRQNQRQYIAKSLLFAKPMAHKKAVQAIEEDLFQKHC